MENSQIYATSPLHRLFQGRLPDFWMTSGKAAEGRVQ
jgi:hypothetical protein